MKRVFKWLLSLFRQVPQPPQTQPQQVARKRKAFKHCLRANIDAPMMQQARDIGRQ